MHPSKIFLIGLMAGLFLIVLAGCGETVVPEKVGSKQEETSSAMTPDTESPEEEVAGQTEEKASHPTSQEAGEQKPKAPQVFAIGDEIKMGSLLIEVNSVRESA